MVLYNLFLTHKYYTYINVEKCESVKAIKYIHKYIYKGSDCATIEINEVYKISWHVDGQYIGPAKAIWHLIEFSMHAEWLSITELTVHTPCQQVVHFQSYLTKQQIFDKMECSHTTLIAFLHIIQFMQMVKTCFT